MTPGGHGPPADDHTPGKHGPRTSASPTMITRCQMEHGLEAGGSGDSSPLLGRHGGKVAISSPSCSHPCDHPRDFSTRELPSPGVEGMENHLYKAFSPIPGLTAIRASGNATKPSRRSCQPNEIRVLERLVARRTMGSYATPRLERIRHLGHTAWTSCHCTRWPWVDVRPEPLLGPSSTDVHRMQWTSDPCFFPATPASPRDSQVDELCKYQCPGRPGSDSMRSGCRSPGKEGHCDRSDPANDHEGDYRDQAALGPEHRRRAGASRRRGHRGVGGRVSGCGPGAVSRGEWPATVIRPTRRRPSGPPGRRSIHLARASRVAPRGRPRFHRRAWCRPRPRR